MSCHADCAFESCYAEQKIAIRSLMMTKVLIIKTGSTVPSLLERGEDFEDWFIAASKLPASNFLVCSVHLNQPLPELSSTCGIIVTGSPAYITDGEQWNTVAADYLRAAHKRVIPILGICYGHQLLAWAFGGLVDFHPQGREIGSVEINLTEDAGTDPLFSGMRTCFPAQASHQQSVLELPEEAVLLAANSFEANHGFRLGSSSWGLQFHPEFSAEIMRCYISERREALEMEGLNPTDLDRQVQASPESASLIKRFADLALSSFESLAD